MSRCTVGSSPRERTSDRSTLRDSSVLRYELNQPCPFLKLHRRTGRGMADGNGIETLKRAQGGARPRGPPRLSSILSARVDRLRARCSPKRGADHAVRNSEAASSHVPLGEHATNRTARIEDRRVDDE